MTGWILLASNSTNPGMGYLDHLAEAIADFFKGCSDIQFVPYALHDIAAYGEAAEERFRELGLPLQSLHRAGDPAESLRRADGVFVGGGNTFRLLDRVIGHGLVEPIRALVAGGGIYMGTSAGSNLACPTIKTTNDMPIVEPPTFIGLRLVTFQVNCHYVDRDPDVAHGGETRQQRIKEFHEEEPTVVVGLREGSWLSVRDDAVTLHGGSALLFAPGDKPIELSPADASGASVSRLPLSVSHFS